MRTNFSTVSRVGYLIIVAATIYFLTELAYGWSLNETARFSRLIFGNEWALAASWVIQLGPQALLLLNGLSQAPGKGDLSQEPGKAKRKQKFNLWTIPSMALLGALMLNTIDTATNLGAYIQWQQASFDPTLEPFVRDLAYHMGFIFCFLVTWSEEAMILLAGVGMHLIGLLLGNFGRRPPKWFAVDAIDLAWSASGAKAAGIRMPEQEGGSRQQQGRPEVANRPVRIHSDNRGPR